MQKILLTLFTAINLYNISGAQIVSQSAKPSKTVLIKRPQQSVVNAKQKSPLLVKQPTQVFRPTDVNNQKNLARIVYGTTRKINEKAKIGVSLFTNEQLGDKAQYVMQKTGELSSNDGCTTFTTNLDLFSTEASILGKQDQANYLPGLMYKYNDFATGSIQTGKAITTNRLPMVLYTTAILKNARPAKMGNPVSRKTVANDYMPNAFNSAVSVLRSGMTKGSFPAISATSLRSVSSMEELYFAIGTGAFVPNNVGSFAGNVNVSSQSSDQRLQYMVDFKQELFTIYAEPQVQGQFLNIAAGSNFNKRDYVYVSSVTYGRRVLVLLRTNKNVNNLSIATDFDYWGFGHMYGNSNYVNNRMMEETDCKSHVIGNPDKMIGGTTLNEIKSQVQAFVESVTLDMAEPISYTVSNLAGEVVGYEYIADNQRRTVCNQLKGNYKVSVVNVRSKENIGYKIGCFADMWITGTNGQKLPTNGGYEFIRWLSNEKTNTIKAADQPLEENRTFFISNPESLLYLNVLSTSIFSGNAGLFSGGKIAGNNNAIMQTPIKVIDILNKPNGEYTYTINCNNENQVLLKIRIEKVNSPA